MRIILLAGVATIAFSLFLIVSNFSINSDNPETSMRSIDLSDLPTKQNKVLDLHETEIGNQYIMPYKKLIPKSQWEETELVLEATISEDKIEKNISYDYYSEMPKPSQRVLDSAAEKNKNPMPMYSPQLPETGKRLSSIPDEAINVDDSLDKDKKKTAIKSSKIKSEKQKKPILH